MQFADLLKLMVEKNGSDLFITAGIAPCIKIHGTLKPVSKTALTPDQARELCYSIMTEDKRAEFETSQECNFAINPPFAGCAVSKNRDVRLYMCFGFPAFHRIHIAYVAWLSCNRSMDDCYGIRGGNFGMSVESPLK